MTTGRLRPALRRQVATVRFRVTALATLVALLVLTAGSAGLVFTQRQVLTGNLDDALRRRAEDLASLVVAGRLPPRPGADVEESAVQVVDADGAVVAASANLPAATGPLAPPPAPGGPGEVVRTVGRLPLDDEDFRVLSRRVQGPEGAFVIHVAQSVDDVTESAGALRTSLTFAVPGGTVLLALLVWWLVGRTLRPVESIRAEVAHISGSDLGRRVPEPAGDDEIARLARTMNAMLDRLEAASERQRRFVADASHELRSPLTRIRSEVEVDLAHPGSAQLQATHRSVLDEVAALQHLVEDLLVLARTDATAAAGGSAVDLDDIVMEQVRRARLDGRVRMDTTGVRAAQVRGDARDLERAVANLLDNAVRHAAAAVTVTLVEREPGATLTIADDGPGIPGAERERVFERFARLDDARGAGGGTGLGLAIAREIARRHGGDITVSDNGRPGACMVMTVPTAPAPAPPAAGRGR
ncbi:MAG: HAMP domain-containing sensor histidine kinase [Acidimicrobiales bacterium]